MKKRQIQLDHRVKFYYSCPNSNDVIGYRKLTLKLGYGLDLLNKR